MVDKHISLVRGIRLAGVSSIIRHFVTNLYDMNLGTLKYSIKLQKEDENPSISKT